MNYIMFKYYYFLVVKMDTQLPDLVNAIIANQELTYIMLPTIGRAVHGFLKGETLGEIAMNSGKMGAFFAGIHYLNHVEGRFWGHFQGNCNFFNPEAHATLATWLAAEVADSYLLSGALTIPAAIASQAVSGAHKLSEGFGKARSAVARTYNGILDSVKDKYNASVEWIAENFMNKDAKYHKLVQYGVPAIGLTLLGLVSGGVYLNNHQDTLLQIQQNMPFVSSLIKSAQLWMNFDTVYHATVSAAATSARYMYGMARKEEPVTNLKKSLAFGFFAGIIGEWNDAHAHLYQGDMSMDVAIDTAKDLAVDAYGCLLSGVYSLGFGRSKAHAPVPTAAIPNPSLVYSKDTARGSA
jgi:hypothetical protein